MGLGRDIDQRLLLVKAAILLKISIGRSSTRSGRAILIGNLEEAT